MRYSIKQLSATTWQLIAEDGTVVGTFEDALGRTGYDIALAALGGIISTELTDALPLAVDPEAGLLPEWWESDEGIAFSVDTPGGRDFSACEWSWRDPATSLVPVMFQTQNLPAHYESELAGFVVEFSGGGIGAVNARGRFYDSEVGRAARDVLLGGRRFGVSVDPTEKYVVDYTFEVTAWDEDGFPIDGEESAVFSAYEIGGFTMEPHPCFENASIVLAGADVAAAPIMASALSVPLNPPRHWMTLAEPAEGEPFLDGMGDDVLVPQRDREGNEITLACPLTIRDDGLVYGHLTYWGRCHVGDPWGPGVCASATPSANGYADFLTGSVVCDDGTQVPAGVLTVGCEHSFAFDAPGVRDHLAHAGMGWADVNVIDGQYGPWLRGTLKRGVTDAQLRLLRSLSLSGEWVGELAGILAVNTPGLPVQRALAASAFAGHSIPAAVLRGSARAGGVTSLVGANIVRRCPECERARLRGEPFKAEDVLGELRALRQLVSNVEQRTRHLATAEAESRRARLRT